MLRVIVLLTGVMLVGILTAQPHSLSIVDCSNTSYNGNYSDSGFQKEGAPCYVLDSDLSKSLELTPAGWVFGSYVNPSVPCQDVPFGTNQ